MSCFVYDYFRSLCTADVPTFLFPWLLCSSTHVHTLIPVHLELYVGDIAALSWSQTFWVADDSSLLYFWGCTGTEQAEFWALLCRLLVPHRVNICILIHIFVDSVMQDASIGVYKTLDFAMPMSGLYISFASSVLVPWLLCTPIRMYTVHLVMFVLMFMVLYCNLYSIRLIRTVICVHSLAAVLHSY